MWYTIQSTEDYLSRLAGRFLDDIHAWPLIYDVNKEVIGSDPNVIRPGMEIWIPVDGAEKPTNGQVSASSDNSGIATVKAGVSPTTALMLGGGLLAVLAVIALA